MREPQSVEAEGAELDGAMKELGHAVHNGVNKFYLTLAAKRVLAAWKALQRRWENTSGDEAPDDEA